MSERESVQLEPAFVLHQRAYKNSSQLVDCLTQDHGRIVLIAQGSRRTERGQRAVLQPFVPLRVSWVRRHELGRLTHVEPQTASFALTTEQLLAGFYLNELLLRLTARGDANRPVFSCYSQCLADLAARAHIARTVRLFELRLLQALGYGLALEHDAETGEPIRPERRYLFEPEHGPRAIDDQLGGAQIYSGRALISLREGALEDEESLKAAKRLLTGVLHVYLGDRPLKSRLVLKDIFERGLEG